MECTSQSSEDSVVFFIIVHVVTFVNNNRKFSVPFIIKRNMFYTQFQIIRITVDAS